MVPLVILGAANVANDGQQNPGMTTMVVSVMGVYFVLCVLAIYLAIRDMQFLPNLSSKVWVLIFALMCPEIYTILHGLSSSAQGIGFFAGSPMPGGGAGMSGVGAGMSRGSFPTPGSLISASSLG